MPTVTDLQNIRIKQGISEFFLREFGGTRRESGFGDDTSVSIHFPMRERIPDANAFRETFLSRFREKGCAPILPTWNEPHASVFRIQATDSTVCMFVCLHVMKRDDEHFLLIGCYVQ